RGGHDRLCVDGASLHGATGPDLCGWRVHPGALTEASRYVPQYRPDQPFPGRQSSAWGNAVTTRTGHAALHASQVSPCRAGLAWMRARAWPASPPRGRPIFRPLAARGCGYAIKVGYWTWLPLKRLAAERVWSDSFSPQSRVKGERGRVQVRRRPTVSALSGPVSIRRVDHHASLAPPHRTGRAVFPHPALGRVSHAGMHRWPKMEAPKLKYPQLSEDDVRG